MAMQQQLPKGLREGTTPDQHSGQIYGLWKGRVQDRATTLRHGRKQRDIKGDHEGLVFGHQHAVATGRQ